jgi:hypothetical protein
VASQLRRLWFEFSISAVAFDDSSKIKCSVIFSLVFSNLMLDSNIHNAHSVLQSIWRTVFNRLKVNIMRNCGESVMCKFYYTFPDLPILSLVLQLPVHDINRNVSASFQRKLWYKPWPCQELANKLWHSTARVWGSEDSLHEHQEARWGAKIMETVTAMRRNLWLLSR